MSNCLVTKLKSVVDNDNLEKLGVIEFGMYCFKIENSFRIQYNYGCPINIIASKDIVIKYKKINEGDTHQITASTLNITSKMNNEESGGYEFFISPLSADGSIVNVEFNNKYNIDSMRIRANSSTYNFMNYIKTNGYLTSLREMGNEHCLGNFDLSILKHSENLTSINNIGTNNVVTGDLSNITTKKLKVLILPNSGITGSLDSLIGNDDLENARVAFKNATVSSAKFIYKAIKLNNIVFTGALNVEDDIENIVENHIKNGRVSGTLTIKPSSKILFNKSSTSFMPIITIDYSDSVPYATVKYNDNIIGTYDGLQWTYN